MINARIYSFREIALNTVEAYFFEKKIESVNGKVKEQVVFDIAGELIC